MKETSTPAANQTKRLGSCLPPESTSDQSVLMRTVLWIWKLLLLNKVDHPVSPQVAKSKRPRWHLVNVVLCLALVGPSLAAPFMVSQTAWAAPARLAHQASVATHLISQRPYCPVGVPGSVCSLADAINQFVDIIKELFEILGALLKFNFAGWLLCILTAGTVPCPTLSNVAPWAFDCPVSMAGFTATAAT